jgi:hypothetical protein
MKEIRNTRFTVRMSDEAFKFRESQIAHNRRVREND